MGSGRLPTVHIEACGGHRVYCYDEQNNFVNSAKTTFNSTLVQEIPILMTISKQEKV